MVQSRRTPPPNQYKFGQLLSSDPNTELYLPEEVSIVYGDGIATFGLGPNVARLTLFNIAHVETSPSGPPREIRVISNHIVMPSNALIETMVNVFRVLKSDPDIRSKLLANSEVLMSMVDSISMADD
jgi:hypothetical protein